MLVLRFEVGLASVDVWEIQLRATGSDPLNDIAQVRLYEDLDCDGAIDVGEGELDAPKTLAPDGTVTFGVPATTLLSFSVGDPRASRPRPRSSRARSTAWT